MTREEAKVQEAKNTAMRLSDGGLAIKYFPAEKGFLEGVEWADKNPKTPWRDAKKELPKKTRESCTLYSDEDNKIVIVAKENGDKFSAYLDAEGIWRSYPTGNPYYGAVTYWMPMPETPKGGEI